MSTQHSVLLATYSNTNLPECASQCMWYETKENNETCMNRNTFICHKYRAEVFNNDQDDEN